jgi:hypothetical protein
MDIYMFRTIKQLLSLLRRHFPGLIAVRLMLVASLLAFSAGCWTGAVQYNIGNGIGRHGEQDIIWLIRDKGARPLAITLNEVCGSRYWEIAVAIRSAGYKGYFDATDPNGCGGSNGKLGFGNAIFYLGDGIQAFASPYVNNDSDNRRALCIKAQLGQFAYLACTTHLDNSSLKSKQSLEFFHWVNRRRQETGNLPTIIGGDFNLTPGEPPMNLWYAHYEEADGSPYNAKSTHLKGKIDYLFYSSGFISQGDAVVPTGKSDHKMLIGLFTKR